MQNKPMTTKQKEAYVRARWKSVKEDSIDRDSYGDDSYIVIINNIHRFSELVKGSWVDGAYRIDNYRLKAWTAAYDFTMQRKQERAELEEEIKDQENYYTSLESSSDGLVGASCRSGELWDDLESDRRIQRSVKRTLARLNRELAELKKGWIG
jgi:hypothetical protein